MLDGDVSFKALTTSRAFCASVERDVHILVESFALTWTWLDNGTDQRWKYGSFVVFERVWCTNGWSRVDAALGHESATREAIYDTICAALCKKITNNEQPLHAIGAALALYLLAKTNKSLRRLAIDTLAYRALLELPEKSRRVLDGNGVPSQLPPPSADIYHIVLLLLGQADELSAPMIEVRVPSKAPWLAPCIQPIDNGQMGSDEGFESDLTRTTDIRGTTNSQLADTLDALVGAHADYLQARSSIAQWTTALPAWAPTGRPGVPDSIESIASQVRAPLG